MKLIIGDLYSLEYSHYQDAGTFGEPAKLFERYPQEWGRMSKQYHLRISQDCIERLNGDETVYRIAVCIGKNETGRGFLIIAVPDPSSSVFKTLPAFAINGVDGKTYRLKGTTPGARIGIEDFYFGKPFTKNIQLERWEFVSGR